MKRISFIAILVLIISQSINAQVVDEGVTFAQTYSFGTARNAAMGGAFNSLGGDFGSISINPAGLGVFRSGSLVLSPGLVFSGATGKLENEEGTINNAESTGNGVDLKMSNFGLVFSKELSGPLKYFNFAIGYNRINDFTMETYVRGVSDRSILDYFARDELIDVAPWDLDPFSSKLAFDIDNDFKLIDTLDNYPNPYTYYSVADMQDEISTINILQKEGHISDWNFAMGFNISHKLYIGASFGINKLHYSSFMEHNERFVDNDGYPKDLSYNYDVTVDGNGYNFKVGAIFKPVEFLRIGASYHSPTFYPSMIEDYTAWLQERADLGGATEYPTDSWGQSIYGLSEYKFRTPMKMSGGLAFLIGKMGVISVDADYIDYSNIQYSNVIGDVDPNNEVAQNLESALNIRGGAEARLGILAVRGGYGYYGSPYKDYDYSMHRISVGLGVNLGKMYFDLAGVYSMRKDSQTIIDSFTYNNADYGQVYSDFNLTKVQAIATIGFKF